MLTIRFRVASRAWWWPRRHVLLISADGGQSYLPIAWCWTMTGVQREVDACIRDVLGEAAKDDQWARLVPHG